MNFTRSVFYSDVTSSKGREAFLESAPVTLPIPPLPLLDHPVIDIRSVMMEMPLELPTTTQSTEENVPHKRVYCPVKQNIRNQLKQKWIEHEESRSAEKYSQETGIKLRRVKEFIS